MGLLYGTITGCILFGQGLSFKIYGLKGSGVKAPSEVINLFSFIVCILIIVPIAFLSAAIDVTSIMFGLVQGVIFCMMIIFYGKSLVDGKIAFCNFIMAMALVVPVIYAALTPLIDEPLTIFSICGLLLFGIAAYFMCFGEKGSNKKASKSSYIFILIAGSLSGVQSCWIKYTAAVYPSVNQYYVLATTFTVSLIIALSIQFYKRITSKKKAALLGGDDVEKTSNMVGNSASEDSSASGKLDFGSDGSMENASNMADNSVSSIVNNDATISGGKTLLSQKQGKYNIKHMLLCGLGVGLATALGNICLNVFSIMVSGASFFPAANGLLMVLAVVLSPVFKEKVSVMQVSGVVLGLTAMILLNL